MKHFVQGQARTDKERESLTASGYRPVSAPLFQASGFDNLKKN
jgi:hypothetical protein